MIYLADANVLSEPTRAEPDARVIEWLSRNKRSYVVDPIIIAEIRIGILRLQPGRKRTGLTKWYESVVQLVECVPWDRTVGLRWAALMAELKRRGESLPLLDSMIAATALTHGFTVATRNVADFRRAGVRVVNPFS